MQQSDQRFAVMPVSRQDVLLERARYVTFEVGVLLNSKNALSDKEFEFYRSCRHLVLNIDDIAVPVLQSRLGNQPVLTFGMDERADVRAVNVHIANQDGVVGTRFELHYKQFKPFSVFIDKPGRFNVYNMLAVIATALTLELKLDDIRESLEALESPGRTQRVPNELELQIYIDNAWQPAQLERLLTAVRPYCGRRLILVCGAGGSRNRDNRFALGRLCGELADHTILTVTSSRAEDATSIVKEMEHGLVQTGSSYESIPDRKTAIERAVRMAKPGDLVLIVGKGETQYEMNSDFTDPVSDQEIAADVLAEITSSSAEVGMSGDVRSLIKAVDGRFAAPLSLARGQTDPSDLERLADIVVTGVSTDTRGVRPGNLFVALQGERFDGHDYLKQAEKAGAVAVLVSDEDKWLAAGLGVPAIVVENTLTAYERLAGWYRGRLRAKVIGVVGSVGKTGTRDMIVAALAEDFNVASTAGNFNNEIGLSATILGTPSDAEILVAEMGISEPGKMEILARMARPDIAVMTMIGYSHIEQLKSLENTRKEKSLVADHLPRDGWLLVNLDDERLARTALERQSPDLHIGGIRISGANRPSTPATDILIEADHILAIGDATEFIAGYYYKNSPRPSRELKVRLEVKGKHHVRNALFGLLCAELLGVDARHAVVGLRNYQRTGNRQKIVELNGVTVINDTYNASAESMFAGFEVMNDIACFSESNMESGDQNLGEPACRRMVVALGGINELGDYAQEVHAAVGVDLAKYRPSIVFACGPHAPALTDALLTGLRGDDREDAAPGRYNVRPFADREELAEALLPLIKQGDVVFVKGSRMYEMEKVCQAIEQKMEGGSL